MSLDGISKIFDYNNDGKISSQEAYIMNEAKCEETDKGIQIKIGDLTINLSGDTSVFKIGQETMTYDYVLRNSETNTAIQFDDALIGQEEITNSANISVFYDAQNRKENISVSDYLPGNAPIDDGMIIQTGDVNYANINVRNSSVRAIDTTKSGKANIKVSDSTGDGKFILPGKVTGKNGDSIFTQNNKNIIR